MAKSMRSKIKRHFRSIKRQSVFAPVENARTQRLATKLAQTAEQQTNSSLINPEEPQEQQHKTDLTSDMIVDNPKISTSGPRNSRHQQRKQKKLSGKKKRNGLIHF